MQGSMKKKQNKNKYFKTMYTHSDISKAVAVLLLKKFNV